MNKELILKVKDKTIYLEDIMFAYEQFVDKIKNVDSFCYVSEIDSELLTIKDKIYFSLYQLKGLGSFKNEISARNEIMNLLMFIKTIMGEVFSIYPIEGMIDGEEDKYAIYLFDNYNSLQKIFEAQLIKENDNYIIKFGFIDLKETIYHIINSEVKRFSFFSSKIQIGLLPIQKEKEGVMSSIKELKKELGRDYRVEIFSSTSSYLLDEKRLLELGIPLIIELGPSNLKKGQVTICTRNDKTQESLFMIKDVIKEKGYQYDSLLKVDSLDKVIENQKKVENLFSIKEGNKFVCCKKRECIEKIKQDNEFKELVMPFSQVVNSSKCICCGDKGQSLFFGKK